MGNNLVETLGIIGGGQLAKMIALAALKLGFRTCIYATSANDPALQCSPNHFVGSFEEEEKIIAFAKKSSAVTIETENIPSGVLKLVSAHSRCHIEPETLAKIRNRWEEKRLVRHSLGLPTTECALAHNLHELANFADQCGHPIILKSLEMGYDGKNQQKINDIQDQVSLPYPLIAEKLVQYTKELSIIAARDYTGAIELFPIAENVHQEGILVSSKIPANINIDTRETIQHYGATIVKGLNFIGLMAVECFLTPSGEILVNELAPRPHNSGHWSMDACNISQFEQLIRIIFRLPMKAVEIIAPCETRNLLGEEVQHWRQYAQQSNQYPMIYGKPSITTRRKMGHVNILKSS